MPPPIFLLGEAYGAEEDTLKHPFVGTAGRELYTQCTKAGIVPPAPRRPWEPNELRDFWLMHTDKIHLSNVFNMRPQPSNDIGNLCGKKADVRHRFASLSSGKYIRDCYLEEVDRLREELLSVRPNVVVALGGTATWALLNDGRISKIRGAVAGSEEFSPVGLEGIKVLPTWHPSAVGRDYSLHPIACLDLIKATRENAYPEIRRPKRKVFVPQTIDDLWKFKHEHIDGTSQLAFDIENRGTQITCIGFAPDVRTSLVVPFVDMRRRDGCYWPSADVEQGAWDFVERLLDTPIPKVGQNALYDIHFLWRWYGITVRNYQNDTMLLSHALQPESPKGLAFLGSVYTDEAAWKLQRSKNLETAKKEA